MPLYNYECRRHGPFEAWRAMALSGEPAPCPDCGQPAPRALSAPRLGMDAALRRAHAVNEKSAHEPRVVRRRRGDAIPRHDAHRDLTEHRAAGATHRHAHAPAAGKLKRASHPWMVRH
ncbi:MAG TPA: zinc ribbon domain-containing protein [Stellaceae bacterium]|nr:zinc ribbon domain-containing protein [Stellaceae bacterium]